MVTAPTNATTPRQRILASARPLFAARGFAPVTMRAIGGAAGLDNSSLYRHFASKSELARAVLQDAVADLASELGDAATATPPTREGITDFVLAAAQHLWDHTDTARLLLHWVLSPKDDATGFDVSLRLDAPGAASGELFRHVVSRLHDARAAGEIRDVAWPESFVSILAAITLRPATYGSLATSQEPERSADAARDAFLRELRVLLHGVLAP